MFGLFGLVTYQGFPKIMIYSYPVSDSKVENVKIKTSSNDLVKIVSKDSDFELEESFSDFINKTKGHPTLGSPDADIPFYVMFSIQTILILGMLGALFFEYYRNRRLLRILGDQ